jgi:RNA polymerase sigma-70 factor (ECF subfamily)
MATNSAILGLTFDFAVAQSIDDSQRWILSAMKTSGPSLVTMLWRILGNEQDVCDAYQQTFLNLAHYDSRQKPKNVQAYLYRTAANIAISMLRRAKMYRQSGKILASMTEKACSVDYANQLDSKMLQQKLRNAVADLPDYLRNIIALHDLAELPYTKVAAILQITTASARVYRSKAITLLAAKLARDEKNR